MGCVISSVVKLVLQIVNTVLAIAFLIVALLGILLKTSNSFVQSLVTKIFSVKVPDDETKQITQFIIDNATPISVILIVGGLVLAAICIIGCLSSCCGCGILLKIYALILIVLMVAQIIAVAVIFSDPEKYIGTLMTELKKLTALYGKTDKEEEKLATAVWNVLTTFLPTGPCCGMKDYKDFTGVPDTCPPQCCKLASGPCPASQAEISKVPGCEENLKNFIVENLKTIMYICIGAILCQVALIVVVIIAICME